MGVVATAMVKRDLGNFDHANATASFIMRHFEILETFPQAPKGELVDSLPDPVSDALREAEENFLDRRLRASAFGYRQTIERALKLTYPVEGSNRPSLYSRIENLKGTLPQSLIELLHEVRFLGNEGVHEMEDPSFEDVKAGREFTRLFLTYTYDLPVRIAAARQSRAGE